MDERRQHKRIDIQLPVKYQVITKTEQQDSVTKDVSSGGVCVFSSGPLPEGTVLKAEIRIPGRNKPVHFTGEVLWCDPHGSNGHAKEGLTAKVGVRFIEISDEDRAAIVRQTGENT